MDSEIRVSTQNVETGGDNFPVAPEGLKPRDRSINSPVL